MEESRKQQLLDILNGPYFRIEKTTEEALALYDTALTHSSLANEMKQQGMECEDYERLEFFGNYFLDFVIAEHLYSSTSHPVGEMKRRLEVTENYNLAHIVMEYDLGLDDAVLLSKGTILKDSIIADTFEAFIGAIYINLGLEKAREVIIRIFPTEIEKVSGDKNAKGLLQEYCLSHKMSRPEYSYVKSGQDHAPTWTASVMIGKTKCGEGSGTKKQKAAIDAAREALRKLNAE
ncbi:ribonuclease III [Methanocalculus taiwanensis]|uniref:Ribonuclease III n=1 Tax=Methanocalculus taiwanensis TaxID=106207 RepID=A0ABD4TJY4_9EURY|nr:putative dsRNA-binding protein [Methanocalculus taiwanensis]MCQ1537832.1 ribonuclease III [Methanocalculus taiwanensis]